MHSLKVMWVFEYMLINYHFSGHKSVAKHSVKNKVQKSNVNTSGLSSTPSIKEQLMRNTNRPRKQQAAPREDDQRSEKTLPFSISKLRKTFSSHPSERSFVFVLSFLAIFIFIFMMMMMRKWMGRSWLSKKKVRVFVFLLKK